MGPGNSKGFCRRGFAAAIRFVKVSHDGPRALLGYELYTDDGEQEPDPDDQKNDLEHKVVIDSMSGLTTLVLMAALLAASSFAIGMLPLFFVFSSQ